MPSSEPPSARPKITWTSRRYTISMLAIFMSVGSIVPADIVQEHVAHLSYPFFAAYPIPNSSLTIAALLGLFIAGTYWQRRRQARISASLVAEREYALVLLDQLVGENHDGVWARNCEGEFLYANTALHILLDLPGVHNENVLQQWRRCIHPQDLALFEQGEKTLLNQGHREIHYRMQIPGKPICWVEDRASIIRHEASAAKTMGFLVDVTERKAHEQKISTLSRYLGITNQTNQAIIRCQNPGSLYWELCSIMTRYGGFSACWIMVRPSLNGAPRPEARVAASSQVPEGLLMQIGMSHSTTFAVQENGLWSEIHLESEFVPCVRQIRAIGKGESIPWLARYFPETAHIVSIPLRQDGSTVASLTLISKPDDVIDDEVLTMLYGISVDVSFALDVYARESRRQETEAQLLLSAKVFESNREGVIITDAKKRILSVNRAFSLLTGYQADEVIGLTPSLLSSGQQSSAFYQAMWTTINSHGYWQGEIWNRRKNGETYPELLAISAVTDDKENVNHYIGVFSDITERKVDQQRLEFLAHHDALTGLPNRVLLQDRVEVAIMAAKRANRRIALIFLDLDNFKTVNDSLGHQVGDRLLISLVARVSEHLRESDTLSRLGGDEFVAVITDIHDSEDAAVVARKILAAVEPPILIDGQSLSMTFSIGIALSSDDGDGFDALLRNADTAMYHAKKAGKRTYRFFEDRMNAGAMEKLVLQNSLFGAAQRQELQLVYQPQVDIASGRIIGAEALLRWHSPEHGNVSPTMFIPIAEESGFILPIGDWVLEEACRQIGIWRDAGLREIAVAVNISGLQFKRGNLVQKVRDLLQEFRLPPHLLELEITESTMVQDDRQVLDAVTELKGIGIQLSIDDFGTGYSNLGYLRQFNADKLKVDQSFVRTMSQSEDEAMLVQTIIQMAHNLQLHTIAEGVETPEQLARLTAMGCEEIQGYLFSRPIGADAFADLLRKETTLNSLPIFSIS
ncbi:MAG: EAL domain-containing protein [Rhodocyclaceae bacterium]|nr:MAG: EAL domain-containing protein [Rhodocyclaceae bacterium]